MKKKPEHIDELLLLKIIENRADESEVRAFNDWYKASDENAMLFEQLKKTSRATSVDNHSTSANWEKVVQKMETGYKVPDFIELPSSVSPGKQIRINVLLRVAAVLFLILGITFLIRFIVFNPEQLIISGNDLKNNAPYQLSDGSLVYLHGSSQISFRSDFGKRSRKITLSGEAFFEIKRNEKMPFAIKTRQTITRVLGTSFNVFSDQSGQVKVSVVTGIVEFFTNNDNRVKLVAGEQGIFNPIAGNIEKTVISDPNFQSWKTGVFVFNETPIDNAFHLLDTYYSKHLVYNGLNELKPTISTTFDNQSLEAVLEELNLLLNTKNEFKNDTIVFNPNH